MPQENFGNELFIRGGRKTHETNKFLPATKVNAHQQTHLKSMSRRKTSRVQKGRHLHNPRRSWKQGQSTEISKTIWRRKHPQNIIFSSPERTNQQEHLIFLNQSEIQFFSSSRRDFSSAVNVSKVTSDGSCSRSSNKSINLERME